MLYSDCDGMQYHNQKDSFHFFILPVEKTELFDWHAALAVLSLLWSRVIMILLRLFSMENRYVGNCLQEDERRFG